MYAYPHTCKSVRGNQELMCVYTCMRPSANLQYGQDLYLSNKLPEKSLKSFWKKRSGDLWIFLVLRIHNSVVQMISCSIFK